MTNLYDKERVEFNKIIAKIRSNPQKGMHMFYEKYGTMIFLSAQSICRDTSLANVVVNETLVKIWKHANEINDVCNPNGWIYKVTVNCAKDEIRKCKSYEALDFNLSDKKDVIQGLIDEFSFYEMIDGLSEREKEIIVLRIVWGHSYLGIAKILNLPLSTVTSIYYRSLKKIKKNFKF